MFHFNRKGTKANLVSQEQAEKEAGVEKMSKGQKRVPETASLAEEQDQATVISSADGTKVLENLQKLEDNFQEFDKIVRIRLWFLPAQSGASWMWTPDGMIPGCISFI